MQRSAAHGNTATQRHSDTARSLPHTAARGNQRATYTQTSHSTAATCTTTLHTLRARQHSSNTQRRHGIAHPPTTASSSVEHSHSAHNTCSTVLQSLSALILQRWHAATGSEGPYRASVRYGLRDCRRHRQHARNTTLPPRSDGVHACVQLKPRNGAHRHARLNPTNDR
jgi:hypothetical protein